MKRGRCWRSGDIPLGPSAKGLQLCQIISPWAVKGWKVEARSSPEKRNWSGDPRGREAECVWQGEGPLGLQGVQDLKGWQGEGTRPSCFLTRGKQRVLAQLISLGMPGCFSPGGILPLPDWVPPLAWTLTCLVPRRGCQMRPELGSGSGFARRALAGALTSFRRPAEGTAIKGRARTPDLACLFGRNEA